MNDNPDPRFLPPEDIKPRHSLDDEERPSGAPGDDSGAGEAGEATAPETKGDGAATAPRGLDSFAEAAAVRRRIDLLAVVLGLVLVVVIAYLVWLITRPPGSSAVPPAAGIRSVLTIEGPGVGAKPTFNGPMGVATDRIGHIYVADSGNDRVCVFDRQGHYLYEFGGLGVAKPLPRAQGSWKPGRFNYPVGIDVGDDDLLYVADFRNDQIQVFHLDGSFVRRFPDPLRLAGKGGSGQDGTGIAVTDVFEASDRVYATDAYQIFVFDRSGNVVRQIGRPGREQGDLDHPNGVAAGLDGTIFVSDSNHTRVSAFMPDGQVLWVTGRIPVNSTDESKRDFGLPRGLTVLDDGTVLVADAFDHRLVRMSPEGKILGRYGDQGTTPGQFEFPNDVDTLGKYVVVADRANDRVQVVELLGR
jgi:DNA-binding beta-propeller fold protein YncE